MKYLCYYSWGPNAQHQTEAIRRFKAAGSKTAQDLTLIGRWTQADFMGGVAVMECDDPKALTEFALMWSDVMELRVVPVLEDQELAEVLERAGK
jgi:hypothetical protein